MEKNLRLVGSKYIKISGERTENYEGKISMDTNLNITGMKADEKDSSVLKLNYLYIIDYAELGKITVEGIIFVKADEEKISELEESWEKKEFNSPEHAAMTNLIIQKASIKAFQLEDELGLPIHIRLPTVKLNQD